MVTVGHIESFNPDNERISAYLERVELFFTANGVAEDKQVATLLSVIGGKTYALLSDLLAPTKPATKSLKDLKEALQAHFEPKPVVIAERFQFHRRNQEPGESVAEYEAELRRLASSCKFGDYLSEAIRDRLVCGLRSESTQKRLLAEAELTLTKALEIAQSMEAADRNTQRLKQKGNSDSLHVHRSSTHGSGSSARNSTHGSGSSVRSGTHGGSGSDQCFRCGSKTHKSHECRYRETVCHACGKKGHLAKVCRSSQLPRAPKASSAKGKPPTDKLMNHYIDSVTETGKPFPDDAILKVQGHSTRPITVTLELNGKSVVMEVDTGAAVSLMSEATQKKVFPDAQLQKTSVKLHTYTEESLSVIGTMEVQVRYANYVGQHTLVVVSGNGPTLFGRDWLMHIRLDWPSLCVANVQSNYLTLKNLLTTYSDVFKEELGTLSGFEVKLNVKPGSKPQFCRARQVPYALRDAVDRELKRLESLGVIESVSHSDWATPLVAVPKRDGSVRLCGDYSKTVNPVLEIDQYPLPRPEDLMSCLTGGCKFSKLDLSSAYQQMILDKESRPYVTVNTQKGLYRYLRLPFGVSSAPAVFQKAMDTILQGLPQVICYLDDILVTGSTPQEHLHNLAVVLERLSQHGLRLKEEKCSFMQDSVDYLGHHIDAQGVHTASSKVEAITKAPAPKNVTELRSFLGMVNYYGKFLHNLSTDLYPLHTLLKHGTKWHWSEDCDRAFRAVKTKLTEAPVLMHYDPELPIRLAGDASNYGIGAVLSHVDANGQEHPIAFVSRTLSQCEKNYSQVEKEALSLIFGIRKFHKYVYGRHFTLVTDHRPLTALFGPKSGVPPLAAGRLQRWALLLSSYSYTIEFRPTKAHANADGLSRLPLKDSNKGESLSEASVFNVSQISVLPVSVIQVCKATRADPVLSKVVHYLRSGWPMKVPDVVKPYFTRRNELSIEEGCILWGIRVVVPKKLQLSVLQLVHEGHVGMVKMKMIARSYIWWPGIDKQIEDFVKSCKSCQEVQRAPELAPLHPWIWPGKPWVRVHLDFAGPFLGKSFLIAVDAYSKWPEVIEMSSTTAAQTITMLRQIFATHGIPEQLVSDNGPQFTSSEFAEFCKSNGVKHIRVSPYHPASNGLAERMVQTFKQSMKKTAKDNVPLQRRLANFLLSYRTTPQATTNVAPCELLMGRALRTRFDMLRPNTEKRVCDAQAKQKQLHDDHGKHRSFNPGQTVWARDFRGSNKWIPGVVVQGIGPVSYMIQLDDMSLWKRHVDHIRNRVETQPLSSSTPTDSSFATDSEPPFIPFETSEQTIDSQSTPQHQDVNLSPPQPQAPRRNPPRNRQPPERFRT